MTVDEFRTVRRICVVRCDGRVVFSKVWILVYLGVNQDVGSDAMSIETGEGLPVASRARM